MTRRAVQAAAGAVVALALALACGEVPTLPGGVAYITPILLPSPSVAVGDTLRDSLGRVAPIRIIALGRDSTDTIRTVVRRFVLTSLNTGALLGGDGILVAPESLLTLRIVGQVTDGTGKGALQLQTPEVTLEVVPLADSIASVPTVRDTAKVLPPITVLPVSVTGTGPRGVRAGVGGIRVRYRIAAVYPASPATSRPYYLADDANNVLRPDSTIALDTTSSSGAASRAFVAPAVGDAASLPDSALVEVRALSQRGVALRGSPVRFVIRIRR